MTTKRKGIPISQMTVQDLFAAIFASHLLGDVLDENFRVQDGPNLRKIVETAYKAAEELVEYRSEIF